MFSLTWRAAVSAICILLAACAGPPRSTGTETPIIFVHGNGDTAALWHTTIWRFESNGYPRERMFAIDLTHPLARNNDAIAQPNRSSSAEQMAELAAAVEAMRRRTRADKVALVGNSRGATTIRNYLRRGGGADYVSEVVLGGGTNHGVIDSATLLVGSEFNAAGPLLRQLNAGPDETGPGPRFLTIRSDNNDKYAQPDGQFIGMPGVATGVTFAGPELKGAENLVLPRIDHRETAFSPVAFNYMYRFIAGKVPETLDIVPEAQPILNGKVSGVEASGPTNLPVAGATVEIHEVTAATGVRIALRHRQVTQADGLWGPFKADSKARYEFVVTVPGLPVMHIYRSPFPRSSDVIHLRPVNFAAGDRESGAVVSMSRPRGYFGVGKDVFLLDGKQPPEIKPGVPSVSASKLRLPPGEMRAVTARFNDESITVQSWPAAGNHVTVAEFHY